MIAPDSGSDNPQFAPGVSPPDAAPFRVPELLVIGQVPSRHAPAELGRRIGDEDRYPVLGREGVGIVGREGRRSGHYRADTTEVVGIDVSLQDHAQRSGHQADGLGTVAANGVHPSLDGEPLEEGERASVADALEHPEQASQMHERRIDHGDARSETEVGGAVGLVMLGTCQYPFEGVVAEVDPLRRSRGPAGQHPYGDTRSSGTRRPVHPPLV